MAWTVNLNTKKMASSMHEVAQSHRHKLSKVSPSDCHKSMVRAHFFFFEIFFFTYFVFVAVNFDKI